MNLKYLGYGSGTFALFFGITMKTDPEPDKYLTSASMYLVCFATYPIQNFLFSIYLGMLKSGKAYRKAYADTHRSGDVPDNLDDHVQSPDVQARYILNEIKKPCHT